MKQLCSCTGFARKLRSVMLALAMAMLVCVPGLPAHAEEREYKVEAAFLYSFFNYITWPGYNSPQALQNPVICVYGQDPILGYLNYVRSKMSAERHLTVRTIGDNDTVSDCNLIFMRHRITGYLLSSLPNNILTVLKPDDPLDSGGMIELAAGDEHISIKINHSVLEHNGFQVSSRLLDLAQSVK